MIPEAERQSQRCRGDYNLVRSLRCARDVAKSISQRVCVYFEAVGTRRVSPDEISERTRACNRPGWMDGRSKFNLTEGWRER